MGQKCDVKMTRARLAAVCLAVLLVMLAVFGVLAFLAVRRYRALLIQAKVDQTRSRYVNTAALWVASLPGSVQQRTFGLYLKSANMALVKLEVPYYCNYTNKNDMRL